MSTDELNLNHNFDDAHLINADFSNISGAHFSFDFANLLGASFKHCVMNSVSMNNACLHNATFEKAIMEGIHCMMADFTGANLREADFYWAIAAWSIFRDTDLTRTNFQGADLKEADFTRARLIDTNLGYDNLGGSTQLQGAHLENAIIEKVNFEGCEYDLKTRFPIGFQPEAHGMVLTEGE